MIIFPCSLFSSTSYFLSWVSPPPLNIPTIVCYSLVFLSSWYLYCRCSFSFFSWLFSSTEGFSRVFTFVSDMGEKIIVSALIWSIGIPCPLNGWESESYPKLFRDCGPFGIGTSSPKVTAQGSLSNEQVSDMLISVTANACLKMVTPWASTSYCGGKISLFPRIAVASPESFGLIM